MAATAQPKVEKKIMEEKIAKVREVVKNVSTNDIILALHNFELDVSRTIHAFCEGGSEAALGDWERTGGAKKRSQKKKSKAAVVPNSSSLIYQPNKNNSGATTPSVASSLINCSNVSSATNLADKLLTNGVGVPSHVTQLSQERVIDDAVVHAEKAFSMQQHQQQHQFIHPGDVVSAKTGGHPSLANHRPTNSTIDNGGNQRIVTDADDSFGLVDYQSQLVQNREMLEREVSTAQEAIYQCFKDLRDGLAAREQQLIDELAQCRKDGHRYFDSRTAKLHSLIVESGNPKITKTSAFVTNLEKFNAKKTDDLEVALTARFLYDSASITGTISQLGKVPVVGSDEPPITHKQQHLTNGNNNNYGEPSSKAVVVPTAPIAHRAENAIKRSNSPSSLVSSVGEDSGLGGQISPVNHVEKGQSVQVGENGIVLKSDSVSADQLAEIQRQIAESLKAKGIDPAVLTNFGAATTVAARRRPPPSTMAKNGTNKDGSTAMTTGDGQQRKQRQQKRTMNNNNGGGGEEKCN